MNKFKLIFKVLFLFKDSKKEWEEAKASPAPWHMTGKFMSFVLTSIASFVGIYFVGLDQFLKPDEIQVIMQHLEGVRDSAQIITIEVEKAIPHVLALFGIVRLIVGFFRAYKR